MVSHPCLIKANHDLFCPTQVGAFERHAPSVDSMHEAAEEKVGQPLSEVVVEEVNDFLDVHKPTLATIEGDVRDAKKRIALAKPRSRPAPKVEPEPASSDEGSASGGDK